jgi:outer membrane protein assembly factor BamB
VRRQLICLLALSLAAATQLTPLSAANAAGAAQSVTYQVNARHDGTQIDGELGAPPLTQKWSRDLGGEVSYPVVANGRVFVTANDTDGDHGTTLYAIDAATGQDAWSVPLGGVYWWSALAYGGGRLYAVNFDGALRAFHPATGQELWSVQLPGQSSFTSPPAFRAGIVYTGGAGSGGTLYAVRATDGVVLWTQPVMNGDTSSPAVTAAGVYVSYACEQTYAFDPVTGSPIWHHDTGCGGGGGRTPVVADGGVWVRDGAGMTPTVLNVNNGSVRATYPATGWSPAPAIDGRQGYFVDDGVLVERHTRTMASRWTFAGDNQLTSAPLVVNGYVYVGSATGQLWALNGATGAPVWSTNVGAPINAPDEHNVSQPLTGFGAGDGLLVVPASNLLVAYGS